MAETLCPLCSVACSATGLHIEDFEYQSPGVYEYRACPVCGLLVISPMPSAEVLNLAYPPTYHAYHEHFHPLARILKSFHWRKKAKRYSWLLAPRDKVLELGCAFGDLLSELRRMGFRGVAGVEFNEKAAKRAIARGLDVTPGEINDLNLKKDSIDMIIMENFIEHLYSPVETMRWCHSRLKSGGILVGETPNIDAWDYHIGGRFWGGYHTPRHIYLFNTANIQLLAEQSGFEVVSIKSILQPAHLALIVQNALKHHFPGLKLVNGRSRLFLPLIILFLPFNVIQLLFSMTSLVEFVFRKRCKRS